MILKIFSYIYWFLVGLSSILLFILATVIYLFSLVFDSKQKKILHLFTSFWASLYSWFHPLWKLKILGRENIADNHTYVMVSNHQSMVDILILFRIFAHFKWVSKIENFKIPFIGWNMRYNDYIQLERGKVKSNFQMIQDCTRSLQNKNSVMIFPEGTRSEDGNIKTFKEGAFVLALKNKTPILPIAIKGTSNSLPKGGVVFTGKSKMEIHILEPIPYESFQNLSSEELTSKVQEIIQKKFSEI